MSSLTGLGQCLVLKGIGNKWRDQKCNARGWECSRAQGASRVLKWETYGILTDTLCFMLQKCNIITITRTLFLSIWVLIGRNITCIANHSFMPTSPVAANHKKASFRRNNVACITVCMLSLTEVAINATVKPSPTTFVLHIGVNVISPAYTRVSTPLVIHPHTINTSTVQYLLRFQSRISVLYTV